MIRLWLCSWLWLWFVPATLLLTFYRTSFISYAEFIGEGNYSEAHSSWGTWTWKKSLNPPVAWCTSYHLHSRNGPLCQGKYCSETRHAIKRIRETNKTSPLSRAVSISPPTGLSVHPTKKTVPGQGTESKKGSGEGDIENRKNQNRKNQNRNSQIVCWTWRWRSFRNLLFNAVQGLSKAFQGRRLRRREACPR